jgi:hypothetical protein
MVYYDASVYLPDVCLYYNLRYTQGTHILKKRTCGLVAHSVSVPTPCILDR